MAVMETGARSSCSSLSSERVASASAMKRAPSMAHLTSVSSADRLMAFVIVQFLLG
jgi:hypothetical protein